MPTRLKCPNGKKQHPAKSGNCVDKSSIVTRKKCPNGSRKHKKTGECKKMNAPANGTNANSPRQSLCMATKALIFETRRSIKERMDTIRPLLSDDDKKRGRVYEKELYSEFENGRVSDPAFIARVIKMAQTSFEDPLYMQMEQLRIMQRILSGCADPTDKLTQAVVCNFM